MDDQNSEKSGKPNSTSPDSVILNSWIIWCEMAYSSGTVAQALLRLKP